MLVFFRKLIGKTCLEEALHVVSNCWQIEYYLGLGIY